MTNPTTAKTRTVAGLTLTARGAGEYEWIDPNGNRYEIFKQTEHTDAGAWVADLHLAEDTEIGNLRPNYHRGYTLTEVCGYIAAAYATEDGPSMEVVEHMAPIEQPAEQAAAEPLTYTRRGAGTHEARAKVGGRGITITVSRMNDRGYVGKWSVSAIDDSDRIRLDAGDIFPKDTLADAKAEVDRWLRGERQNTAPADEQPTAKCYAAPRETGIEHAGDVRPYRSLATTGRWMLCTAHASAGRNRVALVAVDVAADEAAAHEQARERRQHWHRTPHVADRRGRYYRGHGRACSLCDLPTENPYAHPTGAVQPDEQPLDEHTAAAMRLELYRAGVTDLAYLSDAALRQAYARHKAATPSATVHAVDLVHYAPFGSLKTACGELANLMPETVPTLPGVTCQACRETVEGNRARTAAMVDAAYPAADDEQPADTAAAEHVGQAAPLPVGVYADGTPAVIRWDLPTVDEARAMITDAYVESTRRRSSGKSMLPLLSAALAAVAAGHEVIILDPKRGASVDEWLKPWAADVEGQAAAHDDPPHTAVIYPIPVVDRATPAGGCEARSDAFTDIGPHDAGPVELVEGPESGELVLMCKRHVDVTGYRPAQCIEWRDDRGECAGRIVTLELADEGAGLVARFGMSPGDRVALCIGHRLPAIIAREVRDTPASVGGMVVGDTPRDAG